jgi:hypothetical protein
MLQCVLPKSGGEGDFRAQVLQRLFHRGFCRVGLEQSELLRRHRLATTRLRLRRIGHWGGLLQNPLRWRGLPSDTPEWRWCWSTTGPFLQFSPPLSIPLSPLSTIPSLPVRINMLPAHGANFKGSFWATRHGFFFAVPAVEKGENCLGLPSLPDSFCPILARQCHPCGGASLWFPRLSQRL